MYTDICTRDSDSSMSRACLYGWTSMPPQRLVHFPDRLCKRPCKSLRSRAAVQWREKATSAGGRDGASAGSGASCISIAAVWRAAGRVLACRPSNTHIACREAHYEQRDRSHDPWWAVLNVELDDLTGHRNERPA